MKTQCLSEVATSAAPPPKHGNYAHFVILPARDGWKVCFFYDGRGDFGYIERFLSPNGELIEPWTLPETDARSGMRLWSPASLSLH
ncbi:hypothetical protein DWF00_28465 [Bosea caraganae]|uniref:Uncharacterized protein n=1 Tax=Bosea caraganae TaxID=2763117 RepID=A0A370L343_9HYPH|nr:hypothetical protein DWF00_28465 [Bosea caraganae]RDJ22591.1 hypothetical protein DWE98_19360 [Bosea caraganae]